MATTELVQYLQSYVQARKQYEENAQMERDLNKEIQARRRAPQKASPEKAGNAVGPIIWQSVLLAIGLFILFYLIAGTTSFGDWFEDSLAAFAEAHADDAVISYITGSQPLLLLILFYLPALVLTVLFTLISRVRRAKRMQETYLHNVEVHQAGLKDIPRLENEQKIYAYRAMQARQKMTELESKGVLHPSYYEDAERLLEYLVKGRADSLKEALNLLEYDHRQARQEIDQMFRDAERQEQLERMARLQEDALSEMQDGVDRAADAAAKAAGFSAASAFYSWQTAERQRKRDNE